MRVQSSRRGFSLFDLVVVLAILVMLLVLLFPGLQTAREKSREVACANMEKQLAIGCLTFENANKRFPLASDYMGGLMVKGANDPGKPNGNTAMGGYSWMVTILPYLEAQKLYEGIKAASLKFKNDAFHASNKDTDGVFFWQKDVTFQTTNFLGFKKEVSLLRCPVFSKSPTATTGAAAAGLYGGAGHEPVITNYVAMVGSHIDTAGKPAMKQSGLLVGKDASGTAVPTYFGIKVGQVVDGLSNTVLIVESREEKYASWYDGATAWVLGHPDVDTVTSPAAGKTIGTAKVRGLNYGPDAAHPNQRFFLAAKGNFYGLDRSWGPSSEHAGDIVIVSFGDGHVQALDAAKVDKNVWLHICTKDGDERVDVDSL